MGYKKYLQNKIEGLNTFVENVHTDNSHFHLGKSKIEEACEFLKQKKYKQVRNNLRMAACSFSNYITFGPSTESNQRESVVYIKDMIIYEISRQAWTLDVMKKKFLSRLTRVES